MSAVHDRHHVGHGGDGDDVLIAGRGADALEGGAGGDTLKGQGGADRLSGQDGDDRLDGGSGRDVLVGDRGSDTFVFGKGSGKDRILDFEDDVDVIRLDDALWEDALTKAQVIEAFAGIDGRKAVFDSGEDRLVIKGLGSLEELRDDLVIV